MSRSGNNTLHPDFFCAGNDTGIICTSVFSSTHQMTLSHLMSRRKNAYPLFTPANAEYIRSVDSDIKFLELSYSDLTENLLSQTDDSVVFIIKTDHRNGVGEQRAFLHKLLSCGRKNPVILKRTYSESRIENLQIMAGADLGVFLIDGLCDGIWLENNETSPEKLLSVSFGILQASRARIVKTEFISCPGCGRTLFDLQKTIAGVKERTSHLTGLKIGIMGCIVNGPGEMADADYGYVGSGKGMVNLYKGQTCVEKLIPEAEAVERLVELIKRSGDWVEL